MAMRPPWWPWPWLPPCSMYASATHSATSAPHCPGKMSVRARTHTHSLSLLRTHARPHTRTHARTHTHTHAQYACKSCGLLTHRGSILHTCMPICPLKPYTFLRPPSKVQGLPMHVGSTLALACMYGSRMYCLPPSCGLLHPASPLLPAPTMRPATPR